MRDALDRVNRDIVYSLCQYGMGNVWEWGARSRRQSLAHHRRYYRYLGKHGRDRFQPVNMAHYAKPGNWNDPDMLVVG